MSTVRAQRRGLLLAGASALAWLALPRAHAALPVPGSLRAELEAALGRRRALVVLASTEGCPWCKLVRQSYLAPLRAEGQPVVEIDIRGRRAVLDFGGAPRTQAEFAAALRLRIAPTVLFIGPDGREVAPRLTGVPLPDFYGAYLQERLDAANRALA
jgi:hypothetical protein